MILHRTTAEEVAELLLQINAIKLNPQTPYTWASGWKSPIYCDNRIILSYPKIRNRMAQIMAQQVKELYPDCQCIAGVATGAIGIGLLVAQELNLPFVYVRPEPKKHGRQNQIEGHIESHCKVVIIEDLISTGKSSLCAANALKEAQLHLCGMIGIFSYDFEQAQQNFNNQGVTLHTLSNYEHLLNAAMQINYISQDDIQTLKQWRINPDKWNK